MEQKIKALLARIVHPESGRNIVESGMVEHIDAGEGRVTVTLRFEKARDPFAVKIKRQINLLTREQAYYTEKIGQDSALLERLKYDDYLEEYARENYRMQRRNEHVYIMKE